MYTPFTTLLLLPILLATTTTAIPLDPSQNEDSTLTARAEKWLHEPSTLGITVFTEPGCTGGYAIQNPIDYGHNQTLPKPFLSYKVNRPLVSGEQLDFSKYADGKSAKDGLDAACSQYVSSVRPGTATAPGKMSCTSMVGKADCLRLFMSG